MEVLKIFSFENFANFVLFLFMHIIYFVLKSNKIFCEIINIKSYNLNYQKNQYYQYAMYVLVIMKKFKKFYYKITEDKSHIIYGA